jgi:hypothetical protein
MSEYECKYECQCGECAHAPGVASQQPAPIPEDLREDYEVALLVAKSVPDGVAAEKATLIERIARLEAALRDAQDAEVVLNALFPKPTDPVATPLGTPGSKKETKNG